MYGNTSVLKSNPVHTNSKGTPYSKGTDCPITYVPRLYVPVVDRTSIFVHSVSTGPFLPSVLLSLQWVFLHPTSSFLNVSLRSIFRKIRGFVLGSSDRGIIRVEFRDEDEYDKEVGCSRTPLHKCKTDGDPGTTRFGLGPSFETVEGCPSLPYLN